ncbi:DUF4394 domain-containing protein [Lentzea sp. DG1S-22]|uniref:DUF4394 domain-containing protein n=1 Tax=Lentzea sp. DG1S-22 TaxID=3108822 RepID=UPI002E789B49|nr:DUF4394 domain-containing protein [Lentzea sp. DG1S-22]WVH82996.1 DUF4394 domain-containing protein [Lentzea sp. DG1S-22]
MAGVVGERLPVLSATQVHPPSGVNTATDLLGRVVVYTDVNGVRTPTTYDQVDRGTSSTVTANAFDSPRSVSFTYDDADRTLTQELDGVTSVSMACGSGSSIASISRGDAARMLPLDWKTSDGRSVAAAVGRAASGTAESRYCYDAADRAVSTGGERRTALLAQQRVRVTGLKARDRLVGIDVRPATGVTPVVSPNTGRLFTVGQLGVDVGEVNGFDIATADSRHQALAAVRAGLPLLDGSVLVRADLGTGRASVVGLAGGDVVGLAFAEWASRFHGRPHPWPVRTSHLNAQESLIGASLDVVHGGGEKGRPTRTVPSR